MDLDSWRRFPRPGDPLRGCSDLHSCRDEEIRSPAHMGSYRSPRYLCWVRPATWKYLDRGVLVWDLSEFEGVPLLQEAQYMKQSLQSPHKTRRAQLADNGITFPLRHRYRITNNTLECREDAKRLEGICAHENVDDANKASGLPKARHSRMYPLNDTSNNPRNQFLSPSNMLVTWLRMPVRASLVMQQKAKRQGMMLEEGVPVLASRILCRRRLLLGRW